MKDNEKEIFTENENNCAKNNSKFEQFFDGDRHDHESIRKVRTSFRVETATCVKLAIAVFLVYLCITYWPKVAGLISGAWEAALPLVIGAIIAFLVNILMRSLEHIIFPRAKKPSLVMARRIICMLIAFIMLIGIVVLILWLILPQLIKCVEIIIAEVPPLFSKAVTLLREFDVLPEDIMAELSGIDWKSNLTKIFDILTSGIGNVFDFVVSTVSSVFSGIVTALVSIIFAIYLLLGKERIYSQISRVERCYFKFSKRERFNHTMATLKESFESFIVGQCKEAIILGVLCALGMWVFRFPYATMIGALIGFTALIPVAGAYIGGAIGAIMILTESPVKAVLFVIFLVVLQQIEGNLIYPKVVGESIGLPGIWVLTAVTIGGGVMGIPGMLIGVPLAAAAYKLLGEDVNRKLAARETEESPQNCTEPLQDSESTSTPETVSEPEPEPVKPVVKQKKQRSAKKKKSKK